MAFTVRTTPSVATTSTSLPKSSLSFPSKFIRLFCLLYAKLSRRAFGSRRGYTAMADFRQIIEPFSNANP